MRNEGEESELPDGEESQLPDGGESELPDGKTDAEPGPEETDALHVDMGAALDMDEDAVAEAAKTSLDMEGFETGAGFDLDDVPDDVELDFEIEALEVESTTIEDVEEEKAEWLDPSDGTGADEAGSPRLFDEPDRGKAESSSSTGPDRDHLDSTQPPSEADGEAPRPAAAKVSQKVKYVDRGKAKRRKTPWARVLGAAVMIVLVVGAGGVAAAYFGIVEIPGITPPDRVQFTVAAPVVPPGPQPDSPVMSHVLYVDEWREDQTPQAWAEALHERMPDLVGFVTPLLIDGSTRYALLVGPAYSAAEATELRGPLADALTLLNPDPDLWAVQEAPYSFYFGEYETIEEANGRVQELAGVSVPAFVLQVTYPSGEGALRVYGGAFSDEVQAGGMGRILNENALGDVLLSERRGRLPV